MNVLFVSISSLPHISEHSISLDLIHTFIKNGHNVYVVCALERSEGTHTQITEEHGCKVLRVKIGNNKKANIVEKGITTISLPGKYISAIKKYYADVTFDLVLYPTPPITQVKTIKYIKKRDNAVSYLLLKDIFPQNAVDIGILTKTGFRGIIYKYFRKIERNLYRVSDYIGCMSNANVDYILKHNPDLTPETVEVCPNSIEICDKSITNERKQLLRNRYNIPADRIVFIYGGNLGKPQDIPFVINCLRNEKKSEAFFIIVGDGTEYEKLRKFVDAEKQDNVKLMRKLPKEEYDNVVAACDAGMIFLDHRFTIPNFPSRLLGYMQAKIPVLACTDSNTDIGHTIVNGSFGWWCESNDVNAFHIAINQAINDIKCKRIDYDREYEYLKCHYDVNNAYRTILKRVAGKE